MPRPEPSQKETLPRHKPGRETFYLVLGPLLLVLCLIPGVAGSLRTGLLLSAWVFPLLLLLQYLDMGYILHTDKRISHPPAIRRLIGVYLLFGVLINVGIMYGLT